MGYRTSYVPIQFKLFDENQMEIASNDFTSIQTKYGRCDGNQRFLVNNVMNGTYYVGIGAIGEIGTASLVFDCLGLNSYSPTFDPTMEPTVIPTVNPTMPTNEPTTNPIMYMSTAVNSTMDPTAYPTFEPTVDDNIIETEQSIATSIEDANKSKGNLKNPSFGLVIFLYFAAFFY